MSTCVKFMIGSDWRKIVGAGRVGIAQNLFSIVDSELLVCDFDDIYANWLQIDSKFLGVQCYCSQNIDMVCWRSH